MRILFIASRSLRQHALSTIVTALAIALSGGLLLAVWTVKSQAQSTFLQVNSGFDAVLGARGSKLQLVLNAIFHLEASPGNVAWEDYQFIRQHPAVKRAIPIAVGDNVRGYRIVGTDPELFTEVEYKPGQTFKLAEGRLWEVEAEEAVLGSFVARQLELDVGDIFHPFHGLTPDENNQHEETYVVTGLLAPSNTPVDKVIWIPLHGLQTMSGHAPSTANEVSAVLIQLKSPTAGFALDMMYNRQGDKLTFAFPIASIMGDLFAKIGWFDRVLALVAYLVAAVAAAGVLVTIYNSMAARQRDLAILRSLGAHRRTLFGSVVLEAAAIGALGMGLSFAVYAAIVALVAAVIRAETGVVVDAWALHPVMLWAPLGMTLLCALGGFVPAWKAYRTDVAQNLSPVS